MMNPKENALRIIRFDNPERVVGGYPAHCLAYLGCHHEGYKGGGHHLPVGSTWTDIWGTGWQRELEGVMGFPRVNPLKDLPAALPHYTWPDPADERICSRIYEQAAGFDKDNAFLTGIHRDTLWEKAYMLVGMDTLMCLFLTEPDAVHDLLQHIMDFQLGIARHYLKLGVEMVQMGDDLGSQNGLLLSPDIIEEFFIPQYRRLFNLYKERGALINFHSCGHIIPVLPFLMDLGADILNPLQATANDLAQVRRITDGRMALQGGISTGLVTNGPVDAIRREVAFRIRQLAQHGGYFCAPDQDMPWPEDHIRALYEAVDEFGAYPLQLNRLEANRNAE